MELAELRGRKVLIIEDEYLLADDVAASLRDRGAEVVGPVGTLDAAQAAVREACFDCAVLDMNLRGASSEALAAMLRERSVPTLILTGYSRDALTPELQTSEYLEKPASMDAVVAAVARLLTP